LKDEDEEDDSSDPADNDIEPDNILAKKFQLRDEGLIIIKEYLTIYQGKRGNQLVRIFLICSWSSLLYSKVYFISFQSVWHNREGKKFQ
jgi:hypothetical protein